MVEYEDGTAVKLHADRRDQRSAIAKGLMTTSTRGKTIKLIHRHLINGDMLLLNRQPTLHKTSIMAHKVSYVIIYGNMNVLRKQSGSRTSTVY